MKKQKYLYQPMRGWNEWGFTRTLTAVSDQAAI